MENYSEWINNKMYEGHVRRLTQIKEKDKKMSKTFKNFRVKSEPATSQLKTKRQFLPLPLVSKNERLLLSQVVKQRKINMKQKESLLENYLLSKRILETHSVFDSKLLKKQFNFHKKVSESMNRNFKNNRKTFSDLRQKNFLELKKLDELNTLGVGKITFSFKIKEILLMKRRLDLNEHNKESRFSLIYRPQKLKYFSVKAISFRELISNTFHFKATRKQIEKKSGVKFQLQEIRGNQFHKLGEFVLHFSLRKMIPNQQNGKNENEQLLFSARQSAQEAHSLTLKSNPSNKIINPENSEQKSRKNNVIRKSSKNIIEKLIQPITKFLVGTIEIYLESEHFQFQQAFL